MVANVSKAATVGENPWWVGTTEDIGQNTNLGQKDVTAKVMLKASGNDFQVQVGKLRAEIRIGGRRISSTVPGHCAIVREDTRDVLGVVTDKFEPVQNEQAFSFFDEVVGEGQAIYHTSGSLGKGERVWILARLPQEVKINGSDVVENYLLMTNGHDGQSAFHMLFTPIRVVCQNTLNIAVGTTEAQQAARGGYRLFHLKGISGRMNAKDARNALGLAKTFMKEFERDAQKLAQTPLEGEELDAFLQRMFPLLTKLQLKAPKSEKLLLLPEPKLENIAPDFRWSLSTAQKKRELVKTLTESGKGNDHPDVAGTRWAAFNGVAEFADYLNGQDAKRTKSLLFGEGQSLKQRAWNLLTTA